MRNANTAILRDQLRMKPYTVVADGIKFGIALRDKVIIHGMQRERAIEIAAILNSAQESEPDEYKSADRLSA